MVTSDDARAHAWDLLAAAARAEKENGKSPRNPPSDPQNSIVGTVTGQVIQARDINGGLSL